ncbi:hypothetical protein M8494_02465 [Serratia ureilytica]
MTAIRRPLFRRRLFHRHLCRPVCSARTPEAENCTFYPSAAAAGWRAFALS